MPGNRDKNGVTPQTEITKSEQETLNEFMPAVRAGAHLKGTTDQYEIHLSGGSRATFRVGDARQVVTLLQVGGHT